MKNPILILAAAGARILPAPVKQGLYRFPIVARWIRRALNLASPGGFSQVTVAGGKLAGIRLSLDLQSEKDYWLGTYEPELQAVVSEMVRPGMVAYDLGANIGFISLLLARAVGQTGSVFAFEALPTNVQRLRTNLELNQMSARVEVCHMAVTDTSDPVHFLVGPSGGTGKVRGSSGRQLAYQESLEVPGVSLDDFVYQQGHPPPDVIKMDIEGGEVLALPGMRLVLSTERPLILMELHGPEAARVAWESLIPAGYQLYRMEPEYPIIPSVHVLGWKNYLVAKPKDDG